MRKITILVLAMLLMVGTAFALDGLQIGAGLRFHDFDAPNDYNQLDPDMDVIFEVIYEQRFGDFRITSDVLVPIHLDDTDYGVVEIRLEGAHYFADDMFSAILGFDFYIPFNSDLDMTMYLTPGFQFRPTFDFGNMYFRLDLPLYLGTGGDALDFVGLNFTYSLFRLRGLGLGRDHGFGFELGLANALDGGINDDFLQWMGLTPYFANELLYAEVEFVLPLWEDGFDDIGMAIIPGIEVNIPPVDGLSFWLNMPVSNIGADVGDPVIGLGFGARFAF